jgi:monoamine oxidase
MSVEADVIIIGAGAAGIAAAMELRKTSLSFVVLEARNRVGGRACTDHETFAPTPVDLGANWIHHYRPENPIYPYYQEFNVDKQISLTEQKENRLNLDYDGKLLSPEAIDDAKAICEQIFACLKDFIDVSKNEEDLSVEQVIKEEYERLVELQNETKRIVDSFLADIELYEASNLAQLSAKQWERVDVNKINDRWVSSGYGTILEHIADKYSLPIQLNTIVKRINTHDIDRIAVSTLDDSPPIFCRRIIVTIPLGCLKRDKITFEPPLPDWKRKAINQMGFGLLNKFILQFSDCFWGSATTNLWHTSNQQRGRFLSTTCLPPPANILIIFVHSTLAEEFETMTDNKILEQVMIFIRQVFPQSAVPDPIKYKFTRWAQDPFAYGSYSNSVVHSNPSTIELLARDTADGRVHWAGEHTNTNDNGNEWSNGYVHSAFRSGQRAAMAIINQLCSSSSSS